jgi:AraC-like DNA-binding protein
VETVQKDLWDIGKILRMPIDLSETRPIRSAFYSHLARESTKYDMHYGLELGIVLQGRMRRYFREWEEDFDPGQVWLCGMWEPHGYKILKVPCDVAVLIIWPPGLATMRFEEAPAFNWLSPFIVAPKDRPRASRGKQKDILNLGRRAVTAGRAETENGLLWLRMILMEILLTICEGWQPASKVEFSSGDALTRINRSLQMVFENRNAVTVQAAARACGMGRNSFSKLFKGLMGIGFSDFDLRYRLHGVAGQLLQTEDPVKALAAKWGFTDSSHLHRWFVEYYGCSPGEYRKTKPQADSVRQGPYIPQGEKVGSRR